VPPFRIAVDRETCYGAGECALRAPRVFGLDEVKKAVVLDPQGADDETVRQAAAACPVAAIVLVDAATGRQVQP